LLNQIWIEIDNIVLNFFATFGSVLVLQIILLGSIAVCRWRHMQRNCHR